MSAAASTEAASAASQTGFWNSTIGKKAVMAVTGAVLFGYVIVHLIGNLQVFLGPEKLDAYARTLHATPALVWTVRIILLASVVLHVTAAVQLALLKQKARPVSYVRKRNIASSYASRTMYWSGPILFAFIVYHLLHLTAGSVHPQFIEGSVYHNVITAFQNPAVAAVYIVAMVMLGFHLYHGAWSMFQSLGINHPRYTPMLRRFAAIAALVLSIGNISMPLAVLIGILK